MNNQPPDRHRACRHSTYFSTHDTYLQQFKASGFVAYDTLQIAWPNQDTLLICGAIVCSGSIVIDVDKLLEVVPGGTADDPTIRTLRYSYNAHVFGHFNILRYDNTHPVGHHSGHDDPHHKHTFSWKTGKEDANSPIWIGADRWPTLGDVISEV